MNTWSKRLLAAGSVVMVLYHLIASQYLYFNQWEHQTIHLFFLFFLTFLSFIPKAKSKPAQAAYLTLIAVGTVCCAYIFINCGELEAMQGFPTQAAVGVGICLILLAMIGTYLSWGLPLLLVALTFVSYFLYGHFLPGPLHHNAYSFDYVISYLSVGLTGIYGMFLSVSADQVFLFVIFGSLLAIFKVDLLLMETGKILGRRMRGGPGLTAVISNSLIGMVSGAPVANVAITSPFVLPYMRESGYDVDEAGGIIACSATGAQLMPPIMGAAAFMMATFINQPYSVVMLVAIVPALLYYYSVGTSVQFMAVAKGLKSVQLTVNWWLILRMLPVFVLPIGAIFTLLLMHYSPAITAFYAILTTVVVGMAYKGTRASTQEVLKALTSGAVTGAKIGISLALIGTVAQTLMSTGLGAKLAGVIHMVAQGQLFIALLLTMGVALILGCAVPPAAAYALCAIIIIPTLLPMGVSLLNAHMFCFYFSIIGAITPPVGLASLAAAGISGGDYGKTSVHGFRMALAGFILPYMIIYNPLFTFDMSNPAWFLGSVLTIPVSLTAGAALMYGAVLRKMNLPEYTLSAAALLIAAVHIFGGGVLGTEIGLFLIASSVACMVSVFMLQKTKRLVVPAFPLGEKSV